MHQSEAYHIHIDGPVVPVALRQYAVEKLGFLEDDFPHFMELEGREGLLPAHQLTRTFRARASRDEARDTFSRIQKKCLETGFKGFIQIEFIMSRTEFSSQGSVTAAPDAVAPRFPLQFEIQGHRGHREAGFKKHELHLELKKESVPSSVREELASSGFAIAEGNEISFTASGDPEPIRKLKLELLTYLEKLRVSGIASVQGRMITEATVSYQIFGVPMSSTPPLIEALHSK